MFTKLWPFVCCVLLVACAPGTVGVGVGGGSHGAGGGVGVSFPVESESNYNYTPEDNMTTTAQKNHFGPGYPFHNCKQPQGLPPDRDDPYALRWKYQREVDDYRDCIQAYIAKAKRDQDIIQDRIEQANREYQRFMTFGK